MNRFDEAKRDIDRAIELGDIRAAEEIIEHVAQEAKEYEFEELAGQLRYYFLNLDLPGCLSVVGAMAHRASDIDMQRGLAYGPGFRECHEHVEWAMR